MQKLRVVKSIAKIAIIAKLRIAIAKKSQFRKQDNPVFKWRSQSQNKTI